ncbi:Protein of unknown function [Mesobacillus persicus]|uniref:DUF3231 family protein n=1 Tax=Mesobacillus persicus TaxID=930146 RepID=A0A1H7WM96_9BACI|nr:DUF3231 family protein [Mesobacillus persicus]SEM22199.1 Protein of unknown function [Mesobacillus persicus]
MNPIEVIKDVFQPFLDGEKRPVHVGEVMNLWLYLNGAEQFLREEQTAFNVVQDEELRKKLDDLINNVHKPMIKELKDFLTNEGIPLPDNFRNIGKGEFQTVPEGAKLSDNEIANLIFNNINMGITYAARGLTESVRADVSYLFSKFQMMKVTFALTLKPIMEEKGWLRVPPYYR